MVLINQIKNIIDLFLDFVLSINFIIFIGIFIFLYNLLMGLFRDRIYVRNFKQIKDPDVVNISDLKDLPLVNIIIPAWKEGVVFEECLLELLKLSYQKIKVIVNAGGDEKTIEIANSFKKYNNFVILYQKSGQGKIKAINDCLKQISDGLVYLIDADTILNDNIFQSLIFFIINKNEDVVVSDTRPHNSIQNIDLVKYLYINRNWKFIKKYSEYEIGTTTQNTVMKYDVIRKITQFTQSQASDDGTIMGRDIINSGFKIFLLPFKKVESYNFPSNCKTYIKQQLRWLENNLYNTFKSKKKIRILKFGILVLFSLYLLFFPIFLFLNLYLFFFCFLLLFSFYLKKARKCMFFKFLKEKDYKLNFKFIFFVKLIFFIYIEVIINIIVFFELIFYRKNYLKRKNLLN